MNDRVSTFTQGYSRGKLRKRSEAELSELGSAGQSAGCEKNLKITEKIFQIKEIKSEQKNRYG